MVSHLVLRWLGQLHSIQALVREMIHGGTLIVRDSIVKTLERPTPIYNATLVS